MTGFWGLLHWLRWPWRDAREADRGAFAELMREDWTYVLPCGGGALTDLRGAIAWAKWYFGKRRAARLCAHSVFGRGVGGAGAGESHDMAYRMLHRLAHKGLVEELAARRERWLASAEQHPPADGPNPIEDLENLLAALCPGFRIPLPEGIAVPSSERERGLFHYD